MAKRFKYKIGDKAELDDGTEEYDMLGNMPKFQVPGDVHTDDDDYPLVGDREHAPHTVVVDPVADNNISRIRGCNFHYKQSC